MGSIDWRSIGQQIAKYAPLLGTALGGPAGAAAGSIVAAALGVDGTPDAVQQALAANPDAAVKLRQIESDQVIQLQQLVVTAEANRLAADTAALQSVNVTMQAEAASSDPYVRRWRPTWGYLAGIAFAVQMIGLTAVMAWAVIFQAERAGAIINASGEALGSLSVIWGVALSVLGIAVQARSRDKQAAAGVEPASLLSGLMARVTGRPAD